MVLAFFIFAKGDLMSEQSYGVKDFGGPPFRTYVPGPQCPSRILVTKHYDEPEIVYVPLKTSKTTMVVNAYGELTKCSCVGCGANVKPWDNYCSSCGAKLREGDLQETTYPVFWKTVIDVNTKGDKDAD